MKNIISELKHINSTITGTQPIYAEDDNIYYFVPALNQYIEKGIKENLNYIVFSTIHNAGDLVDKLIEQILIKVKTILNPSIVLEYNLLLNENFIRSEVKNPFEYFINTISNDNDFIEYYFEKYENVNRIIDNCIKFTSNNIQHLLERLNKDLTEIGKVFKISNSNITAINGFDGDEHNEWQSPFKITFQSGEAIYYKSRSFQNEHFIYRFVDFLTSLGLEQSMERIPFIDKGNYGWMFHIEHNQCTNISQVENFFFLQGINLALFYFLNCADLIADNIVVRDGKPHYFDLECILLPQQSVISNADMFLNRNKAQQFIRRSVLSIGLLPEFAFSRAGSVGIAASGLSNVEDKINSFVYERVEKRFERIKKKVDVGISNKNIPHIEHIPQLAENFLKHINKGFITAYHFFQKNSNTICNFLKDQVAHSSILSRVIFRSTFNYGQLISESLHPSYLASIPKTNRLFDSLKNAVKFNKDSENIIEEEIRQIHQLDIPTFFIPPMDKFLQNKTGRTIDQFSLQSGLDEVLNKISSASDKDLERNLEIIKYAFAIHSGIPITQNNYLNAISYNTLIQSEEISIDTYKEICIKECEKIAEKIMQFSFDEDDEVSFWNISESLQKENFIGALGYDLFSGLDGIALFFFNLHLHTKNEKFRETAIKIINQGIEEFVKNYDSYDQSLDEYKLAIFSFPICTFYLAELFMEKGAAIQPLSNNSVSLLLQYIEKNINTPHYDLITGASGTIIYLAKLYKRLENEQVLKLIKSLAYLLITNADPINGGIAWADKLKGVYAPGMSHGSSAITYSLFLAFSLLNDNEIYESAANALKFERSMFNVDRQYWIHAMTKDLEFDKNTEMHIWAYGSGGILQSRLLMSNFYQDDVLEYEISVSHKNIVRQLDRIMNFNYSSGIFGIIDIITMTSVYKKDYSDEMKAVRRYIYSVLKDKEDGQIWTLTPYGKRKNNFAESIGLFTGIAGIGNVLLNTIDYQTSVQLFDY